MSIGISSISHKLSKPTSFFGLKLWISIIICIAFLIFFLLLFISLYFISRRRRKLHFAKSNPILTNNFSSNTYSNSSMDRRLLSRNAWEIEMSIGSPEKQVVYSDHWPPPQGGGRKSEVKGGKQYTMREIEAATNDLADENVIGSGDYGVVYVGVLFDNTRVAVKKLISNSGKAEDFKVEVEAMWCVRHKNLVKFLGYCTEGTYRMLVYEYVDNGNLQQWLHGCIAQASPLTWNIRMNIIVGTAKGLAYLHEDSEPPIIHQHIKSSNILLDQQWNPRISDFGIAKLLGHEWSHTIAPPLGMSGYIAPEYAYTGVLNEKCDVYSFGILIMEIISGKTPIEYSGTETEIEAYLIEWLKFMVENKEFEHIVDPKLPTMPSLKELKRIILIALRCVDPEVENRPKMGDVIHMLEPRDLLLSDEHVLKQETDRGSLSKKSRAAPNKVRVPIVH